MEQPADNKNLTKFTGIVAITNVPTTDKRVITQLRVDNDKQYVVYERDDEAGQYRKVGMATVSLMPLGNNQSAVTATVESEDVGKKTLCIDMNATIATIEGDMTMLSGDLHSLFWHDSNAFKKAYMKKVEDGDS